MRQNDTNLFKIGTHDEESMQSTSDEICGSSLDEIIPFVFPASNCNKGSVRRVLLLGALAALIIIILRFTIH